MPLSKKHLQRLAHLRFTSDAQIRYWQEAIQLGGEKSFDDGLRPYEEAAEEYDRAFPQLQAFAAECRRNAPIRSVESFSPKEREQYRILLEKMQEFAAGEGRQLFATRGTKSAIILQTSPVGLTAAAQVFGHTDTVLLLLEERLRWSSEIYEENEYIMRWYTLLWWTITEELRPDDAEQIARMFPPPPAGSTYWLVSDYIGHGPLCGGGTDDLWRWDGEHAEFVHWYAVSTA